MATSASIRYGAMPSSVGPGAILRERFRQEFATLRIGHFGGLAEAFAGVASSGRRMDNNGVCHAAISLRLLSFEGISVAPIVAPIIASNVGAGSLSKNEPGNTDAR